MRIGIGYDIHLLVEGRRLMIGGVQVPYDRGCRGHSDADPLLHAIIDALLGAAGLGDIGEHFPDDDPKLKDTDSGALLKQVGELIQQRGWEIENIDATVIAEQPKLKPFKKQMEVRISSLLEIQTRCVNVKAKTNEGVDAVGRGEAIAAQAAVSLTPITTPERS